MAAPKPKQVRTMTTRFSRPSLIALAVSLSALSGGVTQAAEEMDHSAMGHGSMSMDHSQMGHGSAKAPMEGMDHSKMDHGAMQSESGSMDHSQMGHSQSQEKAPAMDHSKMGHGTMQGQMEGMDHSKMNHGSAEAPRTTSRTPIPVLTDADRQAAFPPLPGHKVHDSAINSFSCSISSNTKTQMRAAPWPGMRRVG